MNMKFFPRCDDKGEAVVVFGRAILVRHPDGKMELRGGSKDDRSDVKQWISMFMHEAVVRN